MLFVVAQIPPQTLMKLAIPLYVAGVILLILTALPGIGITKKGATRWLNVGVVIQPSEILKIAMPLMLAWWFQRREGHLRLIDFVIALGLLVVPVGLIVKQPDLGTAILVLSAGIYVIFFAGLSWRLIIPVLVVGALAITAIVVSEEQICQPDVKWPMLRDYQKNRVCTLLDPTTDPLGKGFHIIQGMIAIGSGGIEGKGFMKGTQTHLEFIPERTTDFIFAAFSEEFGLAGCVGLMLGFVFLIFRGLMIAAEAPTAFTRLLAGAITLELLHLCLRQHGHGERHPAGRRGAAALHQLRRHGHGDARARARHPDVDLEEPTADAELTQSGLRPAIVQPRAEPSKAWRAAESALRDRWPTRHRHRRKAQGEEGAGPSRGGAFARGCASSSADLDPMAGGDLAHDRQAQARSVDVRSERAVERVEDLLALGGRDAGAGVLHLQHDHLTERIVHHAHRDRAARRRVLQARCRRGCGSSRAAEHRIAADPQRRGSRGLVDAWTNLRSRGRCASRAHAGRSRARSRWRAPSGSRLRAACPAPRPRHAPSRAAG